MGLLPVTVLLSDDNQAANCTGRTIKSFIKALPAHTALRSESTNSETLVTVLDGHSKRGFLDF